MLFPDDNERTTEVSSRAAPWWDAGGRVLTAIYWITCAIFAGSLWRTKSLPFVDYPQHLAMAATLRRMLSSDAERALYDTNLLSYNSSFHVLVAGFHTVFAIDDAGKIVVALYFFVMCAGMLALLRATGKPRARAFLMFPVLAGYSMAWGFVNFSLGIAVGLFLLARVLGREHAAPKGDRVRYDAITALVALATAYTHLLATALIYMLLLVALVVGMQTERGPFLARVGRTVRRGLPLLPAVAYMGAIYLRQQSSAIQSFEYASAEGNDIFALVKVRWFFHYATALDAGGLDTRVLSVGVGLLFLSALLRDPAEKRKGVLAWLWVTSALAYLIIPHVFWATNFVFERISILVVITAAVWIPRALPRYEMGLRLMMMTTGVAAAGTFFNAMGAAGVDFADFDAIVDRAPASRRIAGLTYVRTLPSFYQPLLIHSSSYYVARRGGENAGTFERFMSLPVHYKLEKMPPETPKDFEWRPGGYRPESEFARYYDLVLVHWTSAAEDPKDQVFGDHADEVVQIDKQGAWRLYEARGIEQP